MVNRILVALIAAGYCLWGQQQNTAAADVKAQQQKKILTDATTAGTPLPVTINVADNVNIEAVMLPRAITKRIFGKDVANNYAVIEVNISNRSNEAALVLESLLIDVSEWELAGGFGHRVSRKPGKSYESRASAQEIASVEYRIVRGQLLDAQPWSARNITTRALQVLGTIGTAYAFPFTADVVKGIGAWNGAVVPGAEVFWPDGMVGQLNRISDYGFRNNKIIPQQSADIVVAFFPIDRFLTPSLRNIFLDSPALFFDPFLMTIDPKTRKNLTPVLRNVFGNDDKVQGEFRKMLDVIAGQDQEKIDDLSDKIDDERTAVKKDTAALQDAQDAVDRAKAAVQRGQNARKPQSAIEADNAALNDAGAALSNRQQKLSIDQGDLQKDENTLATLLLPLRSNPLYRFLSAVSLNNVHLTVRGSMTVDELTIPSTIESSCFDNAGPEMWAVAGTKQCSLTGRFLAGGVPKIPTVSTLGISAITVDKDASTAELLKFTFNLAKPLDSPVEFDVIVEKDGKNGKTVDSMPYHVKSNFVLSAPTIASLKPKASSGIIAVNGTNFYPGPSNSFVVSLRPASGNDIKLTATPDSATTLTLDTSKFGSEVPPGCYQVVVQVGTTLPSAVSNDKLRVDAAPAIAKALKSADGKSVAITGTQLISTKDCGGSNPEFEFLDSSGAVIGSSVPLPAGSAAASATLAPPANAKQVRLKGSTSATNIQ